MMFLTALMPSLSSSFSHEKLMCVKYKLNLLKRTIMKSSNFFNPGAPQAQQVNVGESPYQSLYDNPKIAENAQKKRTYDQADFILFVASDDHSMSDDCPTIEVNLTNHDDDIRKDYDSMMNMDMY